MSTTLANLTRSYLILMLLAATLSAGCAAGSRTLTTNTNTTATTTRPTTVHVIEVQPFAGASGDDLLIPASISVENTALVLAEREGHILSLRGQEGARVAKGAVLAQFNDEDQRSQLRQAEIEVNRLTVEERQYEALVKLNRSEFDRETLLAKEGVASKSDVERAQYRLAQSTSEYEKTRLATDSARARVEAVRIEIKKSVVRAPIAGIVTRRHISLGTSVAKNDKLFEVARLAPLEVKFRLPQTEKDRVTTGQTLSLSAIDSDRIIASARIRRIDPVADATNNTLGYLADITGGSVLIPGLSVNIHLPRPADRVTYWIPHAAFPAGAVLHKGASTILFVIEGERASARTVLVSAVEGDQVEIVAGLAEGARVVLSPPSELVDGAVIEVAP